MRKKIRNVLKQVLPTKIFERIIAMRSRKWQMKFLKQDGWLDKVQTYVAQHGLTVQNGPFKGMLYPRAAAAIRWCVPQLMGTYEKELHPFLLEASTRQYDCVIDIGSAEGYYACGLARMLGVPVYAYDPEPIEKAYASEMAQLNGVSNLVTMGNLFSPDDMKAFSSKRALVLCDCEGFEEVLFTPETLEDTRKWDIIVELHGSAIQNLPPLNWPHRATLLLPIQHRAGMENELRSQQQSFLICEA
jgi:hypothetical protein